MHTTDELMRLQQCTQSDSNHVVILGYDSRFFFAFWFNTNNHDSPMHNIIILLLPGRLAALKGTDQVCTTNQFILWQPLIFTVVKPGVLDQVAQSCALASFRDDTFRGEHEDVVAELAVHRGHVLPSAPASACQVASA